MKTHKFGVMMRRLESAMKQFEIGMLVRSKSGHDQGKVYVIMDMQAEYLFLVDGKIRTLDHPKKKKAKHVQDIQIVINEVVDKLQNNTLINEDIKRVIKLCDKSQ